MHRDGHVGAALLAFAPVGLAMTVAGASGLALVGAVLSVALAMVPDYDMWVPFLSHRGVTHTLAFAVSFGVVVGVAADALGVVAGISVSGSILVAGLEIVALQSFGFFVGTLAACSHLAADALTPAGVPLFWPFSDERFTMDLVTADSLIGNYLLLVAGALASLAWGWTIFAG